MKTYQVSRQAAGVSYLASEQEIKDITPEEFHPGLEFFFRHSVAGDIFDYGPGSYHYVTRMGRLFSGVPPTTHDVAAVRNLSGCSMADAREALTEVGGDVEQAVAWLAARGVV